MLAGLRQSALIPWERLFEAEDGAVRLRDHLSLATAAYRDPVFHTALRSSSFGGGGSGGGGASRAT